MNKNELRGHYFSLPNDIFELGLKPGELTVYAYLIRCANRKTNQCYPGYPAIAHAVGLSINTVRKHICALADAGLIFSENTLTQKSDGTFRNGPLKYTILPTHKIAAKIRKSPARLQGF